MGFTLADLVKLAKKLAANTKRSKVTAEHDDLFVLKLKERTGAHAAAKDELGVRIKVHEEASASFQDARDALSGQLAAQT